MFKFTAIKTVIGSIIMNLKIIMLASLTLMIFSPVSAVMLSPDKQGQVLIFPYFGTLGGNNSLITIANNHYKASALKVHFRDRQGEAALSFNLYLEGNGSWVAALSQVNGETHLELPDASCILPALDDGSGSVVVPLTSGFLEVIEMGVISDSDIWSEINDFDCDALSALWAEEGQWNSDPSFGLEPPNGGLRGSASIINVTQGSMYSFVATALTEFSDIPQHTAPDALLPDLTTAHDAGTDEGFTTSITCNEKSCVEDTWDRPVDAVAATLMAHSLNGEFSIEPGVGASSEAILTFPLRKFYFDEGDEFQGRIRVDLFVYDRTGKGEKSTIICDVLIDTHPCDAPYNVLELQSVSVISFNNTVSDFEMTLSSNILSEEHLSFFPSPEFPSIPESGQFGIFLPVPLPALLRSNSGHSFFGNPVIGTVLQRFTNGQLTNDSGALIRANYGNAFGLSKHRAINQ